MINVPPIPPLTHDNGATITFQKLDQWTVRINVTRSNGEKVEFTRVGIFLARTWHKKWITQGFKSDGGEIEKKKD